MKTTQTPKLRYEGISFRSIIAVATTLFIIGGVITFGILEFGI